ncbi:complex I intermediate-associated protein [Xylariaceae sp. FL0804]|nr:complex I intermediate-associated protein [Xylariaceae sp. FL0804]
MRSQVARHVLRYLPSATRLRPNLRPHPVSCRVGQTFQRRTFLGFFSKPPRAVKEVEAEPGYEDLLNYCATEGRGERPPPESELVKAWNAFFAFKWKHGRALNASQADCAIRVLDHLAASDILPVDGLRHALRCVLIPPRGEKTDLHLELSRNLYREIRRRVLVPGAGGRFSNVTLEVRLKDVQTPDYAKDFGLLLRALSNYGQALEARDLLWEYYEKLEGPAARETLIKDKNWLFVIKGLVEEQQETALLDFALKALESGIEFDQGIHDTLICFFAQRDNVKETKAWYQRATSQGLLLRARTYYQILQFALRNDQKEWVMGIHRRLVHDLEAGPLQHNKTFWDLSYQWAVLLLGQGIEHIEHMFAAAREHNKETPSCQPDIGSINALLRVALEKEDPYLAERLIALAKREGFQLNSRTCVLQIDYRTRANDPDGAFEAYESLKNLDRDPEPPKDAEVLALNSLIRALCSAPKPNYERVLDITSYLEGASVTLEPETVVAVCITFLKNDETYEVIDTLSLHTVHYSVTQRRMIRKAFADYCADKGNSTARAWDGYALLRQFFPEVETEDRVRIMDSFFDRKRADMATHVFGHMRQHDNPRIRPKLESYVRFFEGLGRCPDLHSLRMVHNMLKMDMTVEPNTMLYNALMIAYTACDIPHRALDYWKDITASPEGPSYATLEILFRACEALPFGDEPAREVWEKITKMDIELPMHVYAAYATALASCGHLSEVEGLLQKAEDATGKRAGSLTLAYIYNALPPRLQKEFEEWADHEYPPQWRHLTKRHVRRVDSEGRYRFRNIKRDWKA